MSTNTKHFQAKLEEEKKTLEAQLAEIARENPDTPSGWEPIPAEHEGMLADENVVADVIESYEDNTAIFNTLEARYKDVRSGLDKIKHNVFGKCQVCEKDIEEDRLEANPAARTCKEHMNAN